MDKSPTLHEMYPHLSEAELREAEENLAQYLSLVLRIYERIRTDSAGYEQFRQLTATNGTLSSCIPRRIVASGPQ